MTGTITKISDGDTFYITADGEPFAVRLQGIDCPEGDQPFGEEATAFASQFLQKKIEYISFGTDHYGRVLADIYLDGKKINELLVENGYAWHYKQYSKDATLAATENQARDKKIGLWSQANPVEPWRWRKHEYEIIQPEPAKETVVICKGTNSERYHKSEHCRGLKYCRGGLAVVSKSEAERIQRTPCGICY